MSMFTRRPIDLARQTAVVASEAGWVIERWADEYDGGASSPPSVSVVVSGGELRGPALLTLAVQGTVGALEGGGPSGVVSEHVPRMLPPPATRTTRGRTLMARLVEHPARGTLDELLARDIGLTPGEAATVLVAVARGLADVHACGWAGVLLTPAAVGFRDDGCPVLTGADRRRALDHAAAKEDLDAYAALAAATCAAVSDERGAALLAAVTGSGHRCWDDVIRAVLCTVDPVAIRWEPVSELAAPVPPLAAPAARRAALSGRESAVRGSGLPARPAGAAGAPADGQRGLGVAVFDEGSLGLVPMSSSDSWALGAAARRDVVRFAGTSVPDDGSWDLEATVLRGAVPCGVPVRDCDPPTAVTLTIRGDPPDERSSCSDPVRSEAVRSEAVRSEAARRGAAREWEVGSQVGPAPRDRPRPSPQQVLGIRDAAYRSGRVLTAMERLLEEIGDRPVGRLVGRARTWAAARPLLVAIAVVPLAGVLLALLLLPADEVGGDAVGKSSSALLRESGTGPDW